MAATGSSPSPPAGGGSPSGAAATVRGVVERILFHNEENGYTVAELRPETGDPIVLTGPLPGVQCGETLSVAGVWTRHPTHGAQLRVERFRSELPASVYGIRKFLGSGLVRGVGPVYAQKIVDRFGERTLEVIGADSGRLREVEGIGPARAAAIKAAWDEVRTVREVMVFLQTYGVGAALGQKIVAEYGTQAIRVLREEPYRAANEIPGVGFRTADKIALNLGLASDGAPRIDAGLLHLLGEVEADGHTAAPVEELEARAIDLLGAGLPRIGERLAALEERREVERADLGGRPAVQSRRLARAEQRLAAGLVRLARASSVLPPIRIEAALAWAEEQAGFRFAPDQAEGLRTALTRPLTVLTGGPGTGKTTILRALVAILRAKRVRVALAAPTGRAAQRLAETARAPAHTVHRLLRFEPQRNGFTVNEEHPLAAECVVVDEASMLDTRLAAAVVAAVPTGAHLLLVGDVDQLPSVGPGHVLRDLMASGLAPVARLRRIFRQSEGSGIVQAAHAVNGGEVDLPEPVATLGRLRPEADLQFLAAPEPEACAEAVVRLCRDWIPRHLGLDPIRDVQVLAPMHKGAAGVGTLNLRLQEALNRGPGGLAAGGNTYRPGDKVIQLRNDYDRGIFNGDLGIVRRVDPEAGTAEVDFGGEPVALDRGAFGDLALAYAVSIHKSQGSEYPVVVLPLVRAHHIMLTRNLLYTGLTRGKRRVLLVGDPGAFAQAVRTADTAERWTALRPRLAAALSGPAAGGAAR